MANGHALGSDTEAANMYLSPQTAWTVRRFLSRYRYRWHNMLALGLLLALLAGIVPPVLDNLLR